MRILGIDPGVNKVGWAVIELNSGNLASLGSGVIKLKTSLNLADKLVIISQEIEQLIINYQPKAIALEKMFVNRNFASSINFSHARGVILATCHKYGLKIAEYAPNTVKNAVTGAGHSNKSQVIYMIKQLIANTQIKYLDESDALAIAYTFYIHNQNN